MKSDEVKNRLNNYPRVHKWCVRLSYDPNFTLRGFLLSVIIPCLIASVLIAVKYHLRPNREILIFIGTVAFCSSVFLPIPLFHYVKRRFVRQISEEDKAYLEAIAQSGRDESTAASLILADFAKYTVYPEKELLRASKPTDDTLLRPTTGNTATSKEQLLRASEMEQ